MAMKVQLGYPWGDENIVSDCINISIPVVLLYNIFARYYYHWGKIGKRYMEYLCIFSNLHVNLQFSQNKKFNLRKERNCEQKQ